MRVEGMSMKIKNDGCVAVEGAFGEGQKDEGDDLMT